jgi:hypothetical protein
MCGIPGFVAVLCVYCLQLLTVVDWQLTEAYSMLLESPLGYKCSVVFEEMASVVEQGGTAAPTTGSICACSSLRLCILCIYCTWAAHGMPTKLFSLLTLLDPVGRVRVVTCSA